MFRNRAKYKQRATASKVLLVASLATVVNPEAVFLMALAMVSYNIYDFYKATNFPETSTAASKEVKTINDSDMLDSTENDDDKPLMKLESDKKYLLHFGRKPGFEDIFKKLGWTNSLVSHSALVIDFKQDNKYLVIGRQSPFANVQNSNQFTSFVTHGIHTQPCNEKYYRLFKDAGFNINSNGIYFTGKEITDAINLAEANICNEQHCTMLTSNCYSFSVYVLCKLMVALDERTHTNEEERLKAIAMLSHELRDAATEHHGVGIITNKTVMAALHEAQAIAEKRLSFDNKSGLNPNR